MHAVLTIRPTTFAVKPRVVFRRMATQSDREEATRATEAFKPNVIGEALTKYLKPNTGYRMTLFPFVGKVEKAKDDDLVPSDLKEKRNAELRSLAASQLTNIDMTERTQRKILGGAFFVIVLLLDGWLVMEKAGFWSRFAVTPLLFFAVAYFASGQRGLCNIAQSGMWQVDGEGLKKIEDSDLARRILNEVQRFNALTAVTALAISLVFSAIPLT